MTSRAWAGRSRSRFLGRWRRGLFHLIRHRAIRFRRGRSLRRELWAMENALAADAPKLASMFEVFTLLTRYEPPMGIESLASAPLLRSSVMARGSGGSAGPADPTDPARQRRLAAIATLALLAVIAAACITVSTLGRPADRSCLVAASAGFGYAESRVPGCLPYPAVKR